MSGQYMLQRVLRSRSIHADYAAQLNEQQLAAVTAPPWFVFLSSPAKAAIEPTTLLICLVCAAPVEANLVASPDGQDRVVTGHTSGGITDNHGEKRTVVTRCCRWSRIGRLSRSGNVHAVLHPLIVQRPCACRPDTKFGCLPYPNRPIGRLSCNRRRDWRRSGCCGRSRS